MLNKKDVENMIIKINKKVFYKILNKYPQISRDFFKKLNNEVCKKNNGLPRSKVVLKDIKDLRGAHLFISIMDKSSMVTVSFTKSRLMKNKFIEELIVKARYFREE